MTNHRERRAIHAIFSALIIVSGSTALVHAREAPQYAEIQPGRGSIPAPVGHRQPIPRDVALTRQAESDKKSIEQDNALLNLPSSQSRADEVPRDENTLTKMIEEENARIDRLVGSICRGC